MIRAVVAGVGVWVAALTATANPINWCAVNPTSGRMNHSAPECSGPADPAWAAFDMVELAPTGPQLVEVGPWATGGADSGCDWDDPPQVVARCLLAPRRERAFARLWTLARFCDPAGPGANGDLSRVAAYCRPVQRVYDAMLILTERPTDPALAIPGVTERGVAFVDRLEPRYQFGAGLVSSLARGALSLDYNRWQVPWTIGRHVADPLVCRDQVCDRDSYSADQARRVDELMRRPVAADELLYDATAGCHYADLCGVVVD